MSKPTDIMAAVGVMSGTSLDGIDVVRVRTDGADACEVEGHFYKEYSAHLRSTLAIIARGDVPLNDILRAERELSDAYVAVLQESGFVKGAAVVGCHGQTIRHLPKEGLTWQLGDMNYLAEKLGVPVVGDFRRRDMAAGGEGAPLVPLFHAMMLRKAGVKAGAVLNIGGVANVTVVDAKGGVKASDCGPGVGLLNAWVKAKGNMEFDKDGAVALSGDIDGKLVARALKEIDFWQRELPRSADRYDFDKVNGWLDNKSLEDGAATLAALTAAAVVDCLKGLGAVGPLYVAGGGARNVAIVDGLQGYEVHPVKELGWDEQAVEAACFGWLAVRRMKGLVTSIPETTGCEKATVGGVVTA